MINLPNLVNALTSFPAYGAVDVFVNDLEEAVSITAGKEISGLVPLGSDVGLYTHGNRQYEFRVFENGIARLSSKAPSGKPFASAALGAAVGAALGKAADAKDGLFPGMLLGLLIGGAIGSDQSAQRVFTLRYDPAAQRWSAYDGGLVRWMKQTMNPTK